MAQDRLENIMEMKRTVEALHEAQDAEIARLRAEVARLEIEAAKAQPKPAQSAPAKKP